MGSICARKLVQVTSNVKHSLAIEILTAAAGLDQRLPLRPGSGVEAAHTLVRQVVPPLTDDRPLYEEIERVAAIIDSGALLDAVATRCGRIS